MFEPYEGKDLYMKIFVQYIGTHGSFDIIPRIQAKFNDGTGSIYFNFVDFSVPSGLVYIFIRKLYYNIVIYIE